MFHKARLHFFALITTLAGVALACNLSIPTPTPAPTPTAIIPLPPALVETLPAAGSQAPLNQPIAFFFNQPMDRASVESGVNISGEARGLWSWGDDATLVFTPLEPLPANSAFTFTFAAGIKAANGLTAPAEALVSFTTGDLLRVTHVLPENGAGDTSAAAAVVAAFNQPVVPLGAETDTLPAAFTIQPSVPGVGQWVNTSTYIFYPQPAFYGGAAYTVTLNNALQSASGAPLAPDQVAATWNFTTAAPQVVSFEPANQEYWPLDGPFVVTFNQPMDRASVENGFRFAGANGASAPGTLTWNEKNTVLTFTPSGLLARGVFYTLSLDASARSAGGAPLSEAYTQRALSFPDFGVIYTDPQDGGMRASLEINFTTPTQKGSLSNFVTVSPPVDESYAWGGANNITLYGYGAFQPDTVYTVTILADLEDKWGQRLGRNFTTTFRTPPAEPAFSFPGWFQDTNTILPDTGSLPVTVTNLSALRLSAAAIPLTDYLSLVGADGYNLRQSYLPRNLASWQEPLDITPNRSQRVSIPIQQGGGAVTPGIYVLWVSTVPATRNQDPHFVVASNVNVTLKIGAKDALVWAADIRTGQPLGGRSVTIYDQFGGTLASGTTSADGIFAAPLSAPQNDLYNAYHAVVSQPGQDDFGLASAFWAQGVEPYVFDVWANYTGPQIQAYLYTDRPIYRPGQTVYFRGVLRTAFNGRYDIPNVQSVDVQISNDNGSLDSFNLPLSAYGTFEGEYTIPEDGIPGYYSLNTTIAESPLPKDQRELRSYFGFGVANYRKPEYEVLVGLTPAETQTGQAVQAEVRAQYYFGAPAGDLKVTWNLYRQRNDFRIPGYRTSGCVDYFECGYVPGYYGESIANGEAVTGPDGRLTLALPADAFAQAGRYTLEATAYEQDGFPVSGRAESVVHADAFYVGIRPNQWFGQSGAPLGFELSTTDWDTNPVGGKALRASFQQVTWELQGGRSNEDFRYVPKYTPVDSTQVSTGADGLARVTFTPKKAGTYVLEVTSGKAKSVSMVWVAGAEQTAWPNLPMQQVRLTPDKESYKPGETASVFIPNPIGAGAQALVTFERGAIFGSRVIALDPAGSTLSIPLTDDYAPNFYVTALILGPNADFRMGYLELEVAPDAQVLTMTLTPSTERAAPGDTLNFDVRVTDSRGRPVQGEFSLSVVDKAVLALADPNSQDIVPAFYDPQALGVRTGFSLAVFGNRLLPEQAGGRGGGGGDATITVREEFPDTALWQIFTTNADGRAQIALKLPDSLTTWSADARGLTADTRVGQARVEVVVGKPLLIRPVTPRFLVAGDRLALSAIVNNNTGAEISAKVTLQASGFSLDDPASATQTVSVPANGRITVTWPGAALNTDSAGLVFSVEGGGLNDAARPVWGDLPILKYSAPKTYVTAGVLPNAGSRLEIVSLPRSFVPLGGQLDVELSPSLAGVLLQTAQVLELPTDNASADQFASYLLTSVETYRTLKIAGQTTPDGLDSNISWSITRLIIAQESDGGWKWYPGAQSSDPLVSAFAMFSLNRAVEAGFSVPDSVFGLGRGYLTAAQVSIEQGMRWRFDEAAFLNYVLQVRGGADPAWLDYLYDNLGQMSSWAQALLARTLELSGDPRADGLFTNLQTFATNTASGVSWQPGGDNYAIRLPDTPRFATAIVMHALIGHDANSPLLEGAARYLASQRDSRGGWGSQYETAWVSLALNDYAAATGDFDATYGYVATLNTAPLLSGQMGAPGALQPVSTTTPLTGLSLTTPNALFFSREAGAGRLYYRAALRIDRPVETVPPFSAGLTVSRLYYEGACEKACKPITTFILAPGALVKARITLSVPADSYNLVLEDYIPAGAEILDTTLKTTRQGEGSGIEVTVDTDQDDPYRWGWGWWLFGEPQIYDDHISWRAEYLPAGTYELTYMLLPAQKGQFRVLPARSWLYYFPEVQGVSAGSVFEIR